MTTATRAFSIAGVECAVSGDRDLLLPVELTYQAFVISAPAPGGYRIEVRTRDGVGEVTDSEGYAVACAPQQAPIAALDLIVRRVVGELARRGIYAVHAASLAAGGRGLLISGRSGAGKSTLALALVGRGFQLLSDEFGLCAPEGQRILPYRRAVHVRPGTPELIPQLAYLSRQPRHELGGGSEWSLSPEELEWVFPGGLGDAVELGHVLWLEPRQEGEAAPVEPISSGVAAIELTRATPAAADDFQAVLARMSQLAASAHCGRLRPGELESSLDAIVAWVEAAPAPGTG